MYIAPNSVIRVLKDCPLDNTYDHSIYFGSRNAQTDYFIGLTKYIFTEQTYQRVKRGYMRVGRKAEDLYDCNYIMFQNTSFGNKWFYAFITSVEYVNNEVSEIQFEIDPLQTYWFDFELEECFVEREHSVSDGIGDNLVKENVGYGDYVYGEEQKTGWFRDWKIVVAKTGTQTGSLALGHIYGNKIFQMVDYDVYDLTQDSIGAIRTYLAGVDAWGTSAGILGIYMFPGPMCDFTQADVPLLAFHFDKKQSDIGGYIPRNKKLLCYPYNFLRADNMQGQTIDYHYEYFGEPSTVNFRLLRDISSAPTVTLFPVGYNTDNPNTWENMHETLSITNFPQCGYANSDLTNKLINSAISIGIGILAGGVMGTVAAPTTVAAGVAAPVLGEVAKGAMPGAFSGLGQMLHGLASPNIQSHNGHTNPLYFNDYFDFTFTNMHIRPEFAKILDDYFDRFGYATLRVKKPNINSRPHWNYTKTAGCTIKGSMPADDERKICSIFDNGITFWKNGDEVGNYSLNNTP